MRTTNKVLLGFAILSVLSLLSGLFLTSKNKTQSHAQFRPQDMIAPIPTIERHRITPTPTPVCNKTVKYYESYIKMANLDRVAVSAVYMQFESIGQYYITAYCPEECGYNGSNYPTGWITSTGTICHREDEWWKPSTCGINTSVNHYGDLFLIDGKVFVAEDTGPGAVGHWIDTFMPDYESMSNFGSHWTEVYSVEYVETEPKKGKHYDIHDFSYDNRWLGRCPYRNGYRIYI